MTAKPMTAEPYENTVHEWAELNGIQHIHCYGVEGMDDLYTVGQTQIMSYANHIAECRVRVALEEAEAEAKALREALDKEPARIALSLLRQEIRARGWIAIGRGDYEWDDDRYMQETGHAFEAVLKIINTAIRQSDIALSAALARAGDAEKGGEG